MKYRICLLLVSCFLLTACLERPLDFERAKPNYDFDQFKNEVIAQSELDRIQKLKDLASIASNTEPLTFSVEMGTDTFGTLYAYQYCWRVPGESCSPTVREPKAMNYDYIQYTYPADSNVTIWLDLSLSFLPTPTNVSLFEMKDGELTELPIKETGEHHYVFKTLPQPITHTYILRAEFVDEHIYGLAHYAFKITGK